MSVIVKGMKMPTSCTMCWLNTFCGVWNTEQVKHKGFNERLENCPLTEMIQCKDCIHFSETKKRGAISHSCGYAYGCICPEPDGYCNFAETKRHDD